MKLNLIEYSVWDFVSKSNIKQSQLVQTQKVHTLNDNIIFLI